MKTEIWTRPDPAGNKKCLYRGYLRYQLRSGDLVRLDVEHNPLPVRDVVVSVLPAVAPMQIVTLAARANEAAWYAEAESILPWADPSIFDAPPACAADCAAPAAA